MNRRLRARRTAAVGVAAMVFLAGCSESGGGSQAGGDGLPFGSTKAEYQEAFADVDPIEIVFQSSSARGSLSGRKFEDYAEAVNDWSDGKITFDLHFSNSIAPAAEVDNALVDGRLDMGSALPVYEPSEFPANDAYVRSMVLGSQTPVAGLLQTQGWISEVGYQTQDVVEEFEDKGMHMLLPAFTAGSTGLLCRDMPRDTFAANAGAEVGITSNSQGEQIRSLGGTPVSLVFTEMFESLQRGVIDCTTSIMGAAVLGGFVPEAPHIVLDEEVGFGLGPGTLVMSSSVWDDLPLVAQQLLFDRMDAFLGANFEATWENVVEAIRQSEQANGQVVQFDEEARAALVESNEAALNDVRSSEALQDPNAFVDDAIGASETWGEAVEQLGYTDEVGYADFADWYQSGALDLAPYFDLLLGEVLAEYRPS